MNAGYGYAGDTRGLVNVSSAADMLGISVERRMKGVVV